MIFVKWQSKVEKTMNNHGDKAHVVMNILVFSHTNATTKPNLCNCGFCDFVLSTGARLNKKYLL